MRGTRELSNAVDLRKATGNEPGADSREVISRNRSKEIFFGVVGPVGAGGSRVITSLERACESSGYICEKIKASDLIRQWATENGHQIPDSGNKTLEIVKQLQDLGDLMRESDTAEVARAALRDIAQRRAVATKQTYTEGQAVQPDVEKRAYLIESIRHPAEISLLRRTYANSFALIGVVCEEEERRKRILGKYFTTPQQLNDEVKERVKAFMVRDSDDPEKKHGQHVTEAFYEADFFVDNTDQDPTDQSQFLDEPLGRLISLVSHDRVIRPSIEETAMHHAHSACVRSACLSRQVGAALVDRDGTIIATGVNEVPRAGGGVYGESFSSDGTVEDHRCAFRGSSPYCSSNREQNKIIDELITAIPPLGEIAEEGALSAKILETRVGKLIENDGEQNEILEELIAAIPALGEIANKAELSKKIRKTRLGQLIEFSRAVHAEMDALLSAGRMGVSTVGTRLFVTTYPCHYCALHIVSSGVYEVQFIEPYPKSLAVHLHDDAIEVDPAKWIPPEVKSVAQGSNSESNATGKKEVGKVLFHPFVGVAPRLYVRAFEKTWRLKNKTSGDFEMDAPEWGDEWAPFTVAYPELEAALTRRS